MRFTKKYNDGRGPQNLAECRHILEANGYRAIATTTERPLTRQHWVNGPHHVVLLYDHLAPTTAEGNVKCETRYGGYAWRGPDTSPPYFVFVGGTK